MLPVPLVVPVGQFFLHLGLRGPELLSLRHQQQAHPAAQLALRLGVEPCAELLYGLALQMQANGITFRYWSKLMPLACIRRLN